MRTSNTFSILFRAYSSRAKDNLTGMYARITVNRKKVNINLKQQVDVRVWDSKRQRAKGNSETTRVQKAVNGKVLLYARITINKKRVNISLKRKFPLNLWDFKQRKMVGSSSKAKEINEYLELTKSELYNNYQILRSNNKPITADNLKNAFFARGRRLKNSFGVNKIPQS
ncbi:MAG: Arm DNA-binding domain-containing protein [Algibacter sp.]